MVTEGTPDSVNENVKGFESRALVVGIGASAGGLEALQAFFDNIPPESGMAFVVVQHLDPDRESLMPELLANRTKMRVSKIQDHTPILPDQVYVIAPNTTLTVEKGVLKLATPTLPRGYRHPIDSFFESLADDQDGYAVGVVLSGTGSDGTIGLRAIKERSGITIAQEPSTCAYDGMPRSAITSGFVDFVLPVELMPGRLLEYFNYLKAAEQTSEEILSDDGEMLRRICIILREHTGYDFTTYKPSTLVRRIQRRLRLNHIDTLSEYLQQLRKDSTEASTLCQEFLIGVTQFFRDTEAFKALQEQVIPNIFAHKSTEDPVRIWVPGCSTGEEAYSIAILMAEHCRRNQSPRQINVFATDLDVRALDTARRGWYPQGIADQVSPDLLEAYFTVSSGLYQVSQSIRQMCIFAKHDVTRDPPFSQMDLVSCRNLLIYLLSEAQQRLLPILHYSLGPGGYLFLGKSENIAAHTDLFETVDRSNHIYRSNPIAPRAFLSYNISSQWLKDTEAHSPMASRPEVQPAVRRNVLDLFYRVVLEEYAPSALVINEHGAILEASGDSSKYLQLPQGVFENNIFSMARRGLRTDLRKVVGQSVRTNDKAVSEQVTFRVGNETHHVRLTVRPLPYHNSPTLYIVLFESIGVESPQQLKIDNGHHAASQDDSVVQELENELLRTKEDLSSTIEELESSNEELKSANEELMSMNEELQSTNEELQTSKEELQSVNEELHTVNSELTKKLEELNQANDYIENLLKSTEIATIFLDQTLKIKRFTPATQKYFPLVGSDVGRSITDITSPFSDSGWRDEVIDVIRDLRPIERQIRSADENDVFMMRIVPYRTRTNVIDGAVVTFVPITDMLKAQIRETELAAIVEASQDAIYGYRVDGTITSWNHGAERLYGYTSNEMIGQNISILVPEDRVTEQKEFHQLALKGEVQNSIETLHLRRGASKVDVALSLSTIHSVTGEIAGVAAIARDISPRKLAEEEQKRLARELDHSLNELRVVLDLVPVGIAVAHDKEARLVTCNQAGSQLFQISYEQNASNSQTEAEEPPYRLFQNGVEVPPEEMILYQSSALGVEILNVEYETRFPDGNSKDILVSAVPLFDEEGNSRGCVASCLDVTEQRRQDRELEEASRNKDEFLAMLGHELRNPLASIASSILLLDQDKSSELTYRIDAIQIIKRQSEHLKRLVDDLVDLSRISRGTIRINQELVNMTAVAGEVAQNYRLNSNFSKLNIHLESPPQAIWVVGDKYRLTQILDNLVSNACKFTKRGGDVAIYLRPGRNNCLELTVSDTGIGVDPEFLSQMFGMFQQFHHTGEERTGLGIGLALSKGLVEIHRGSIRLHSDGPGKGFQVTVSLPLANPAERKSYSSSDTLEHLEPSLPRKVLIIEDDPDFASSLSGVLSRLDGHAVRIANNGQAGLETVGEFGPDVVLCDLSLAGEMAGSDVAQAIKQRGGGEHPKLVIALTGFNREQGIGTSEEEIFDCYITKPPDFAHLRRIIANLAL